MRDAADAVETLRRAVLDLTPDAVDVHPLMPGLAVYRGERGTVRMPSLERPYVMFVLVGTLALHQLGAVRQFEAGNYVVSEVQTPTMADATDSWLALIVDFSIDEIGSVLLELDEGPTGGGPSGDASPDGDAQLLDALARLVKVSTQTDSTFMSKHLRREIVYRLLIGRHGHAVAGTVVNLHGASDIYHVNSWIKQNYRQSFTVDELARASGLSPSAFHRKFRSAVQMGPLQCQKVLRLSEARRMLLEGTSSVADAAVYVGYESVSQFTREYKREFGSPPRQDLARVQERLREIAQRDDPVPPAD
ncbi:AraC family transcriptional regulator [Gordonia sp. HY285]|uniref:AraC family transcriptional regulator n=1 Tax=Gordonia liuliyuniae TaxID=2911517 RepID=UPI001F1850DD|nr:AraC family transcriptional regulator [Gordonia liuliyuniae]MCF8610486.1 AraC family transcriptional regulator [Gordonia liuliyuniae]